MKIYTDEKYLITSLTRFLEIFDEKLTPTTESPYQKIYRGQGDEKYELKPGIGRLFGGDFNDIKTLHFLERNTINHFEIQSYHELKEENRFITLAVAQHHGMKTRLLDWTLSPLVALFFAVESEKDRRVNGAFFAYNKKKDFVNVLKSKEKSPFATDIGLHNYLYIPSLTPRIKAQSGVFQLFKNPEISFDDVELEKFIIPFSAKDEIMADLLNMGVNYNSLFPDLDGLAKNINYIYLNENLLAGNY